MTVKELIKFLEQYSPSLDVFDSEILTTLQDEFGVVLCYEEEFLTYDDDGIV